MCGRARSGGGQKHVLVWRFFNGNFNYSYIRLLLITCTHRARSSSGRVTETPRHKGGPPQSTVLGCGDKVWSLPAGRERCEKAGCADQDPQFLLPPDPIVTLPRRMTQRTLSSREISQAGHPRADSLVPHARGHEGEMQACLNPEEGRCSKVGSRQHPPACQQPK